MNAKSINSLSQANRRLQLLLNRTLYQHNIRYFNGSAVEWAVRHGYEATARKALEEGVSPNACCNEEWKPMALAPT